MSTTKRIVQVLLAVTILVMFSVTVVAQEEEPIPFMYHFLTVVETEDGSRYELRNVSLDYASTFQISLEIYHGDQDLILNATHHMGDLNTRMLTLYTENGYLAFWWPLIKTIERHQSTTTVTLHTGETFSGTWYRNLPHMYGHEDFIHTELVGYDVSGNQIRITNTNVVWIENYNTIDQIMEFVDLVVGYEQVREGIARPVVVQLSSGTRIGSSYGHIDDGGGWWSGYKRVSSMLDKLEFWPEHPSEQCNSVSDYDGIVRVAISEVATIEFTDTIGVCDSTVLNVTMEDGGSFVGSLKLVSESYGGVWYYSSGVADSLVLIENYGLRYFNLREVDRIEFTD